MTDAERAIGKTVVVEWEDAAPVELPLENFLAEWCDGEEKAVADTLLAAPAWSMVHAALVRGGAHVGVRVCWHSSTVPASKRVAA